MRKKLMGLLLVVALVLSTVLFVVASTPEQSDCEDGLAFSNFENVDEIVALVNAGYITPVVEQGLSALGASGSCSNIFGHRWNDFGSWFATGGIHHRAGCPTRPVCFITMERTRTCNRTNCTAIYTERSRVYAACG